MDSRSSLKRLTGVMVFLIAVAGYVWWNASQPPPKPRPEGGSVYYTGPMRNKGNPNLYGTDDGKAAPAPPGDLPAAKRDTGITGVREVMTTEASTPNTGK